MAFPAPPSPATDRLGSKTVTAPPVEPWVDLLWADVSSNVDGPHRGSPLAASFLHQERGDLGTEGNGLKRYIFALASHILTFPPLC